MIERLWHKPLEAVRELFQQENFFTSDRPFLDKLRRMLDWGDSSRRRYNWRTPPGEHLKKAIKSDLRNLERDTEAAVNRFDQEISASN